jgi:hypothetical protein
MVTDPHPKHPRTLVLGARQGAPASQCTGAAACATRSAASLQHSAEALTARLPNVQCPPHFSESFLSVHSPKKIIPRARPVSAEGQHPCGSPTFHQKWDPRIRARTLPEPTARQLEESTAFAHRLSWNLRESQPTACLREHRQQRVTRTEPLPTWRARSERVAAMASVLLPGQYPPCLRSIPQAHGRPQCQESRDAPRNVAQVLPKCWRLPRGGLSGLSKSHG